MRNTKTTTNAGKVARKCGLTHALSKQTRGKVRTLCCAQAGRQR
ncbi:hypothetical protein HMPREF3208_00356, partial [Gardnerella vaginalis]